jgi:hypothetical protein
MKVFIIDLVKGIRRLRNLEIARGGTHVAVLHFLAGYEIDKELMNKFNRRIRNLEIARGDTLQYSTL